MKKTITKKGDTPMRANSALVIEPAESWKRLQAANPDFFYENLDELLQEQYRAIINQLMLYERQEFLRCNPYQRHEQRLDQANGFYKRHLTTRCGRLELEVPRTRTGLFRSQVIRRYKRRDPAVDEAIKNVFLRGVSTRQAGAVLASLLDEAVSAATVSQVAKVLDDVVEKFHQRSLQDHYKYVILDGVSVRIRLVGAVRRRMALCAYGITKEGKRELIDFLITKAEGEDAWKSFLMDLSRRGLKGQALRLVATDGAVGMAKALAYVWPRARHQRCWVHKLRNLSNKLKASQQHCVTEARDIYQLSRNARQALQRFRSWKAKWQKQAPAAVACLEKDLDELLEFFQTPPQLWKRLRSTNVIERLFVEVRRRIRTMCAFTTRQSCERILYSVFNHMNTYWEKRPL
jgi:putative transposase